MKALNILRLYRVRLRARWAQECLAILGIAAGVALLLASLLSSAGGLQGSVAQLSQGLAGNATVQLLARDPHGFPQSMVARVRRIAGVSVASPLLEAQANAVGPRGSQSVELIGADPSLSALGGALVRHLSLEPFGGIGAVVLPAPLASSIGVTKFGKEVTFQIDGRTATAPLYAQLGERQIGALTDSPVAIVPLSLAQEMTGLPARVSRILVRSAPGSQARVDAALSTLADGHLNVEPIDWDERLFSKAAIASSRSSTVFAAISALVGFLFAFNAMLLTVPHRRRLIADLRRDGYSPRTVIAVMLLDALIPGAIACVLGLALGVELWIGFLHADPALLSIAFTVGSQRVIGAHSVEMAIAGGMAASLVASLSPLRDVLSRDPLAAIAPAQISHESRREWRGALAGVIALVAATVLLVRAPQESIPTMTLLIVALLFELPLALILNLALVRRAAAMVVSPVGHFAAMELSAARARALAIAATGAVAVFGSVAIQGARDDLLAGLQRAAREQSALSDLWVAPAGAFNALDTTPFKPTARAAIARLPGVRSVGLYRGGLLDWADSPVLVIAPPSSAMPPAWIDQIVQGNALQATERVRSGGWLIVSQELAEEHHLRIGQAISLPSPNPTKLRVAALATDMGWAPGAIVMSANDYAHAWSSDDASAYGVTLRGGASQVRVAREIERVLGAQSGLMTQSAAQRSTAQLTLDRRALAHLTQIATLIPIVAVLAMAAALAAMIWQRRPHLAKLKLEGCSRATLSRTILTESVLLLGVGCVSGAIFGVYGQRLADVALAQVISFPVLPSIAVTAAVSSIALVASTALAIVALPGYLAARVSAAMALQD